MSSDEDEYDIMASRRKSTLKDRPRILSLLEDEEPSSPSNFLIEAFRSSTINRPVITNDSEDDNDSDTEHEKQPTRNFFDDENENQPVLYQDKPSDSINRKYSDNGSSFTGGASSLLVQSIASNEKNSLNMETKYQVDRSEIVPKEAPTSSSSIILKSSFSQKNEDKKSSIIEENLNLKTKLYQQSVDIRLISEKYEDKPEFKDTIDRFLLNKPFWFDLYKNKRDKVNLLNEAIKSNDGSAILAVVLFLRRTLSLDIFFGILNQNPIALNQYSFYLKQIDDKDQLVVLEKFQENGTEIATILSFNRILCDRNTDLSEKLRLFHDLDRSFGFNELNQIKSSRVYQAAFKHLTLLKIQKEILKNNCSMPTKNEAKQMAYEKLYENTVWYTLSFCLKYKQDLQPSPLYSMEHFKREFALTDKQSAIFFIKSMAETSQWSEITNFLNTTKTLFNLIQRQNVRHETIVSIIYYSNGPEEQIKKYLSMIEDLESKKLLALSLKIYDIAIDVYKKQKDRIGLYMMLTKLKKDSIEYIKANEVLQDDKIKWKN